MPLTYQAIATVTVGAGGAATMTFSNIPQTFTDLALKVSARVDNAAAQNSLAIQFNGNATANYPYRRLYNSAGSVGSDNDATAGKALIGYINAGNQTASTFGSVDVYIPNYTSTTPKSMSGDGVNENNAASAMGSLVGALWSPATNAAITSITLLAWDTPANFVQHTSATLYGIKNS